MGLRFMRSEVFRLTIFIVGVFCIVLIGVNRFPEQVQDVSSVIEANSIVPEVESTTTSHPNIIFMMIDDQGFSDIGYNSRDLAKCTPNLDTMASEGIKFHNYYTMHICTPARASLLTGLYAIHHGIYHEVIQPNQLMGLSLKHRLLPQYLQDIGYDTYMIGKWHLGHYAVNFTPSERGFDHFYGYYTDQEFYIEHTNEHEAYTVNDTTKYYYDLVLDNEARFQDQGILSTELFQKRAQFYIENQDPSTPFFLYLAWQNVHGPLEEVPVKYFSSSQKEILSSFSEENYYRRTFAQLTMVLDDAIGHVMTTLKESGVFNNTVVIVASDNGGCPFNGGYSYPLRGRKHTLFEGGARVNAFVHSPLLPDDVVGQIYEGLFHVTDWFPTIIDGILGEKSLIEHLELDGVNQWGAITGSSDEIPRTEMVYNIDPYETKNIYTGSLENLTTPVAAIRVGHLKYITGESESHWYWPTGILNDDESLIENYELLMQTTVDCFRNVSTNTSYLFNLTEDPFEMHNLVGSQPELVEYMQTKLDEYMDSMVTVTWAEQDADAYEDWDANNYAICPWIKL